jgi:hypothetical protein
MSYYSTYFGIKHSAFVDAGVFDGQIGQDVNMHINPLLLRNCEEPEFKNAYDEFLNYFNKIIILAKAVQEISSKDRCFRQILQLFQFKEIRNTGLGYSEHGTHGTGISGTLSRQLARNAVEIVRLGIEDPAIFTLLPIFEEGVGADRISDMTITILRKNFIAYSVRNAQELGLKTAPFWIEAKTKLVNLPVYKKQPIILVPTAILSNLPMASDPSEADEVSAYNRNLRNIICEAIGISWKDFGEMHKKDLRANLLSDANRLQGILQQVAGTRFVPYDFSLDRKQVYLPVFVKENFILPNELPLPTADENNVKDIVFKICERFKELIENNRMSTMLFSDGKAQSESFVQRLFYCTAALYCEANNIDINRESDPGCGELDFKFSYGAHKKVIIEIKLSSNKRLQHGLITQLPIYMETEKAQNGIFMVLRMSPKDDELIERIKEEHIRIPEALSKPLLLIIDGVPRLSASKA